MATVDTAIKSKIIQVDGVVYYIHPSHARMPLARLARDCSYRIDLLCSVLKISPRSFRRQFDSSLGICPKKYLKSERMVSARILLRGGLTVKEASTQLGFNAQKDFYREFREYYEIAPSDFIAQETERIYDQLGFSS